MKAASKILDESGLVNRILPHKNKWAWDLFIKSQANNWVPSEVSMAKDVEQWKSKDILSDDERLLLRRCLGFFAGSESLVSNNLLLNIFRDVKDAECRQYILRQANEEALHNQTIVYICDSLSLDADELYGAYVNIPSIAAKDNFLIELIQAGSKDKIDSLRNIVIYYIVCEGIFFFSGFAMLLGFGRQNKMPGVCEQVQYTLRDESLHIQFGTALVNKILSEEPELNTKSFKQEIKHYVEKAVELEVAYAKDVLPRGILGMSADLFVGYMQYIANRRLEGIGLEPLYKSPKNPFPWLSEVIDIAKQKNFFETRVIEYQSGGFLDDF